MSDYTTKVKQSRAALVFDARYRLQPSDFDDPLDYWEWRAGELDYEAIEATEAAGIARVEARLLQEQL